MNHSTAPVVFQFDTCRSVRIQNDETGNPLFQANDLCALLAYKNPHDAVRRHVETDDLVKREVIDARGRTQLANFVREPGMWALILGSETEQSKVVKRWVTSEVLPAIRKNGHYAKVGAGETAPQPAVGYYELYQEATALLCKLGGTHGRGAAVIMLAQFEARNLPGVARERLPEFIATCKKVLGATANPAPAAPVLTQQQAEEITRRLDNLARLFHPLSEPFADVMGVTRALRGLDPKLGAAVPSFVPLLPDKGVHSTHSPEMSFHDAAILTLRAKYAHGDYKALARDLGIHESSAKKIVGRLALARLDLARGAACAR